MQFQLQQLCLVIAAITSWPHVVQGKKDKKEKHAKQLKRNDFFDASDLADVFPSSDFDYHSSDFWKDTSKSSSRQKNRPSSRKHQPTGNDLRTKTSRKSLDYRIFSGESLEGPPSPFTSHYRRKASPYVSTSNVTYSDVIAQDREPYIQELSNYVDEVSYNTGRKGATDAISSAPSALSTTRYNDSFDSFAIVGDVNSNKETWRRSLLHGARTYDENNEFNPTVPVYMKDCNTAQSRMHSGICRDIGRDNKPKLIRNRNTGTSGNDGGCILS